MFGDDLNDLFLYSCFDQVGEEVWRKNVVPEGQKLMEMESSRPPRQYGKYTTRGVFRPQVKLNSCMFLDVLE